MQELVEAIALPQPGRYTYVVSQAKKKISALWGPEEIVDVTVEPGDERMTVIFRSETVFHSMTVIRTKETSWERDRILEVSSQSTSNEGPLKHCRYEPALLIVKLPAATGSKWTETTRCEGATFMGDSTHEFHVVGEEVIPDESGTMWPTVHIVEEERHR